MSRRSHIELDPKLQIVLVSGRPDFNTATQRLLKTGGFNNVTSFTDPAALLQHCATAVVDMLVCDLHQNDLPAWELIKKLKTAEDLPNLPIVFTGIGQCPVTPNNLAEYGVYEFLAQPFDLRVLMNSLVMTYSSHQRQDTLEGKFSVAKQALLNNQTIKAIDTYQGLYEQTNQNSRSTVGLAQAYEKNHDFHQANQIAAAAGPTEDINILQMKLRIALSMDNHNQASDLAQMILSATQYSEFYFKICIDSCVQAKAWPLVQKLVKAAFKRNFKGADFYLYAARASYHLDATDEAFQMLLMAEKISGPSLKIYEVRGRCHLKLEQYEAAINVYTLAIRLDPKNPQTFFNRALAQLALGRTGEAEADLEQALKVSPSFVLATQKLKEIKSGLRCAG